jgi:hypothetical protein
MEPEQRKDGGVESVGELRPNYYRARVKVSDYDPDADDARLECFDLIDALADGDFYMGNAIKYIFRAGRKSPSRKEDIDKAITYLKQCRRRGVW